MATYLAYIKIISLAMSKVKKNISICYILRFNFRKMRKLFW